MDLLGRGWRLIFQMLFLNMVLVNCTMDLNWITQIASYMEPIPSPMSRSCIDHTSEYLVEMKNLTSWAVSMMDASAKYPAGVLSGNIRSMGNFDQCLRVQHPRGAFEGKYCLLRLRYSTYGENKATLEEFLNLTMAGRRYLEYGDDWANGTHTVFPLYSYSQWAVCVPSSCTTEDVELLAKEATFRATEGTGINVSVSLDESYCYTTTQRKPYETIDYVTISVFTAIILLIAISSVLCQIMSTERIESSSMKALSTFSLMSHWERLVDMRTSMTDSITCLEGMRSLSTMWVVMTHQIVLISQLPYMNKLESMQTHDYYFYYPLWNSYYNVDTFLFVSGLLRSFNLMKELSKGRLDIVRSGLQRYLRLTPAYLFVILFYMTFFARLDTGPSWNYYVERNSEACRVYWWQNLLYINNYAPHNEKCLLQSWYLSTDMQLYLFAPLLVYPLWKWRYIGKIIMAFAVIASVASPLVSTYLQRHPGTFQSNVENSILHRYIHDIYMATHNRMSPYFVGMFMGYIFHKNKRVNMSKWLVIFGWIMSQAVMCACIYGPKEMMTSFQHPYNLWEATVYGGFHRFAWALALAWLVYACHTGHGGLVNTFLSCNVFRFLGRLSYCVYLTHFAVLLYNSAVIQVPKQIHTYISIRDFLGDFVCIFIISILLYICVESPFNSVTKQLFRHKCFAIFQRDKRNISK